MSIESKAKKLLSKASSEKTSEKKLNKILDQHWECFDGTFCMICEFIDEDVDSLINTMAENPSISPAIQSRLQDAALLWQGRDFGFYLSLASNPNISDDFKQLLLDDFIWVGSNDGFQALDELLVDITDAFSANPRFSQDEIDAFTKAWEDTF